MLQLSGQYPAFLLQVEIGEGKQTQSRLDRLGEVRPGGHEA